MTGKIILNLAISLDGYIAAEDGSYDWIMGDGNKSLNTERKWDYSEFLKEIDVVVMGKNCYDQEFHKGNEYADKEIYIATTKEITDYDNLHFINDDIVETMNQLKQQGKRIFLFGGGVMIDSFIKENAVDEYVLGMIPTILGNGRKLFLENNPKIDLKLEYYAVEDGVVIMRYVKR